MKHALGIDVGGTKILTALVDETGRVLREWRTPTPAARGGPAVLAALGDALEAALAEVGREQVVGVGVSAAGQIDVATGVVTYASPNLPGWTGTPVGRTLRDRLGLPVTVENDGNAAAYGEWWAGAGRGAGSLVVLTVGTGVGGGVLLDGRLRHGGRWRAGELGHLIVQAEGVRCNCGQTGCLEVYASGTAIARLAREARPGWDADAPAVFAAAEAGDALALAVLRRSTRFLAAGLVSIANLFDPERILIGGGVATQPRYLGLVLDALADPLVVGTRGFDTGGLALASLREAAGAVGAAGLALR